MNFCNITFFDVYGNNYTDVCKWIISFSKLAAITCHVDTAAACCHITITQNKQETKTNSKVCFHFQYYNINNHLKVNINL